MTLLVVALGGAAGSVGRWLVGGWVQGVAGTGFPWGTLTVNVVGSLLLGFTATWLHQTAGSEHLRHLVAVGFIGSFTTFSTFSFEALELVRDGAWWRAGGYTVGSVVVGLAAVAVGAALAVALAQPGRA